MWDKNRFRLVITLFVLVAICAVGFWVRACNQDVAKKYGGTMTVDLKPGEKLVNATWKEGQLWYLVREMREDEKPEIFKLKENSRYGVLQGTVVFKEHSLKN